MKIKILQSYAEKLANQVEYIAQDKPEAAQKFRIEILAEIAKISKLPFSYRQSRYFGDANIREMIFKGYTTIFRVSEKKQEIEIFALIKWQR